MLANGPWRHYSAGVESGGSSYVEFELAPEVAVAQTSGVVTPARSPQVSGVAVPPEVPRLAAADPGGSLSVDFLEEIVSSTIALPLVVRCRGRRGLDFLLHRVYVYVSHFYVFHFCLCNIYISIFLYLCLMQNPWEV